MKFLICFLSLMVVSVALAEEPAELVKLRKTWENSQAEAKKSAEEIYRSKNIKANKLYYEELNEMKKNFMTAQNLQGAIAVDAEIKKLKALHGKQEFEAPKEDKKTEVDAELEKLRDFLEGAWIQRCVESGNSHIKIFTRDNKVFGGHHVKPEQLKHNSQVNSKWPPKWTLQKDGRIYFITWPNQYVGHLTFNYDNPDTMTEIGAYDWNKGKKYEWIRLK